MSELHKLLAVSAIAPCLAFAGPGLDQAEVKLPYGELKSLITAANRPPPEIKSAPISALLAMRFRLSLAGKTPVLDSTFRTSTFSDGLAMVPLIGGDVTIENQKPPDARILISEKMLCQALEKTGTQVLEIRLVPSFGKDGANLSIPACPASLFDTVVLLVGGLKGVPLHPMHVFFVSAGFFAFHLLFAYLVDLVPIHTSFAIATIVSLTLVGGYLRVVGGRALFLILRDCAE